MKMPLFVFAMSILAVWSSFGEVIPNLEKAKTVTESAIREFSDGNFQDGLNELKPYWPASPITIDNMAVETKKQWPTIMANYGNKLGLEYLKTSTVGESLVKFTHLVRFERYALVFDTVFYKAKDGWIVIDFKFNDSITKLF